MPNAFMHSNFISNPQLTAALDPRIQFHLACVHYNDNTTETITNCTVENSCTCNPAENDISCYCKQNTVTPYFDLSRVLPITTPSSRIQPSRKWSTVIRTKAANVELALSLNSAIKTFTLMFDNFERSFSATEVQGCYNCIAGATTTLACVSNIHYSIAEVECTTQTLIQSCSRLGYRNVIRFLSPSAQFRQLCRAK